MKIMGEDGKKVSDQSTNQPLTTITPLYLNTIGFVLRNDSKKQRTRRSKLLAWSLAYDQKYASCLFPLAERER